MQKRLRIAIICSMSAFSLCGCGDKTVSGGGGGVTPSGTVTIATVNGPSAGNAGTIYMGTSFAFTATVASGDLNNQPLVVTTTSPVASVTTIPTGCTLGTIGSTCSYTVTTNWDNTRANGSTANYTISLSAGNAILSPNTISYTYTAPSTYLPQTGAPISNAPGIPYPSPRFTGGTGSNVGCLTDNLTGLTWAINADITSNAGAVWSSVAAAGSAQALVAAYTTTCADNLGKPWRLPTINELLSLLNYSDGSGPGHYLTNQGFTSIRNGYYWSSTAVEASAGANAWVFDMLYGDSYGDGTTHTYFVWPVRGGQ